MMSELSWLILPWKSVPTWLQPSDMFLIQTLTGFLGLGPVYWSSVAWIQILEMSMRKFLFVSALDQVPSSQYCAEYKPGSCWRQYLMQYYVTPLDSLSSALKPQKTCFTQLPNGYSRIQDWKMIPWIIKANLLFPLATMPLKSLHKSQFWL